jgi:hypothetical protein
MGALHEEVPAEDQHLVAETPRHPVSVPIYGVLKFPNDFITFHAQPSVGGKPWFDYGWLRVADDQAGAEADPFFPDQYRMLVKFWGFPDVHGKIYAVVSYHQRVLYRGKDRGAGHPLLRGYKMLRVFRRGNVVNPLYAVATETIIGSAVVFPDPDVEGNVLYMPNDLEICNGSAAQLPDVDSYLPSIEDIVDSSEDEMEESGSERASAMGSDGGSDGEEEEEEEGVEEEEEDDDDESEEEEEFDDDD